MVIKFEPLSLMEGDPDKLKCGDREVYFMDIDLGDSKVYPDQ
ncbi:hypothetical protein BN938_2281 [Mucinivorans hirudinis]|uniref:Uncharacterized protein n=1 Tax=Mucinivorans hirudinis TaxID=1433126 RepID=A0A060RDN6_9BACT|nr:hypothetical protein BN938_2281 [Mucinivorans hirudinis]